MEFEIIKSKKLSKTLEHNVLLYMGGYGITTTNFFNDYDSCVKHHDEKLLELVNEDYDNRKEILNKIINKSIIPKFISKEEKATNEILDSLCNRRGFDGVWDCLDENIQKEIFNEILDIIKNMDCL